MPGIAFHITARTQGRERWFTDEIKPEIERIITTGVTSSKALFLAHCVMDNHFHIVLRQGAQTLGWIMQPIMRRISLLVQRVAGVEGHVFERRFRSHPCENADYLRRAIVYTNLNATRAQLCGDPTEYAWTSHTDLFIDEDCSVRGIQVMHTLNLFAQGQTNARADLRGSYLRYVDWRLKKDEHDAAAIPYDVPEPRTDAGDVFFATSFCALPPLVRRPQGDLRDKATEILARIDSGCSMDTLRYGRLNRHKMEVRRQLISALLQLDYAQCSIADFLRVSASTVSLLATRMRYESA
jgi:putative transposase